MLSHVSIRLFTRGSRQFFLKSATMSAGKSQIRSRHSFVPLGKASSEGKMQLEGIVFDMDGTLCEPQNYMFAEMRAAVGIPKEDDILDFIYALPETEQKGAFANIQDVERRAMEKQVPSAGLVTLMEYLDEKEIRKGICTRNFDTPVTHFLEHHIPSHATPFSPTITRDFRPPKPSPAGILHIAYAWGITYSASVPDTPRAERLLPLLMVGDSIDDIEAGYEAGALTVFLRSPGKEDVEADERTDLAISRLDELVEILEAGIQSRRAIDQASA